MTIMERIVSVFTPYDCIICGYEGLIVCEACLPAICPAVPSRCYICHASTIDFAVCAKCRPSSKLRRVYVRSELSGTPKQLVHGLKYSNVQSVAVIMANFMTQILPESSSSLIVPVPTATSRLRRRGYDHTELIAASISRVIGVVKVSALVRLSQTSQVGSRRSLRVSQLKDAYRIARTGSLVDAHVLLIDDVITTGATLESAAACLKDEGVKTVDAIVFAQR